MNAISKSFAGDPVVALVNTLNSHADADEWDRYNAALGQMVETSATSPAGVTAKINYLAKLRGSLDGDDVESRLLRSLVQDADSVL